jgi:hypothetical protein
MAPANFQDFRVDKWVSIELRSFKTSTATRMASEEKVQVQNIWGSATRLLTASAVKAEATAPLRK